MCYDYKTATNLSLNVKNNWCNISAFSESKFPVGSSAKIILGLFIKALATATLCCSPPDSSEGLWFILFFKPRSLKSSIPLIRDYKLSPEINLGIHTFSRAENSGSNSWNWKMKPIFLFLNFERHYFSI